MGEIEKPKFTKHYIASSPGVQHDGETLSRHVTTTGQPDLETFDSKEDQLAALDESFFPELPDVGSELAKGERYKHGEGVVEVRQDHVRTEHEPSTVPALFMAVGNGVDWIEGEKVRLGESRSYDGKGYECRQDHVTQAGWEPPNVPALWVVINLTADWVAGEKVSVGDERTYKGILYRCRQSHTTQVGWEPPNVLALWLPI